MNAEWTADRLAADFRKLGLARGDRVLLHSSLASLGRVAGGAPTVVQALLDTLGPDGTLAVPAFGNLGVIPQALQERPDAVTSIHPLAAVAAVGRDAEALCRDHWKAELAHGDNTPYTRLAALNGWVLLLGVDQDRNTTLHTAEALLRLPYLTRTAEKTFDTPEGPVTRAWPFFPGPHRDFIGIDPLLRASGKMIVGRVGNAVARLIRSRDLIDLLTAEGARNPAWALCDNPACADCVRQRAALRRARLAREPFRLAAGARLAGRYVPEMIERLQAAGLDAVELDWIQGRPAAGLADKPLADAVAAFQQAGIAVSALRAFAVGQDDTALPARARAAGIGRIVLPLSHRAAGTARAAAEAGVEVAFANAGMTADAVSDLLLALDQEGLYPRFVFDAAAFARAGEKPFLVSYKRKLRRYVDQLDVADARFDGVPTPLAEGNAEIKEMLSILRCARFAGWCVLTALPPPPEAVEAACGRLVALLDRM